MFETYINIPVVLVAAIVNMILGFLWYSPLLFAKPWMKLMGLTKNSMEKTKNKMGSTYTLSFVAALITSYMLAVLVKTIPALTLAEGAGLAAMVWLGFVAPVQFTEVIFGGKPLKLYLINTGYQFVSMLVMGGILALWA